MSWISKTIFVFIFTAAMASPLAYIMNNCQEQSKFNAFLENNWQYEDDDGPVYDFNSEVIPEFGEPSYYRRGSYGEVRLIKFKQQNSLGSFSGKTVALKTISPGAVYRYFDRETNELQGDFPKYRIIEILQKLESVQNEISTLLKLRDHEFPLKLTYHGCAYQLNGDFLTVYILMQPLEMTLEEFAKIRKNKKKSLFMESDHYKQYNILRLIARQIAVLHELELYHLDIKPANIMIQDTQTDLPYLIDFGSTIPFLEKSSGFSPIYADLEIKKGIYNNESYKTDIWAFGISIGEIYFGIGTVLPDEVDKNYSEDEDNAERNILIARAERILQAAANTPFMMEPNGGNSVVNHVIDRIPTKSNERTSTVQNADTFYKLLKDILQVDRANRTITMKQIAERLENFIPRESLESIESLSAKSKDRVPFPQKQVI